MSKFVQLKDSSTGEPIYPLTANLPSGISAANYIVDSGMTEDGWSWQKWSNGMAECHYRGTHSIAQYATDSLQGNTYSLGLTFPITFLSPPAVTFGAATETGGATPTRVDSTENNCSIYWSSNWGGNVERNHTLHVSVHGKWSEGEYVIPGIGNTAQGFAADYIVERGKTDGGWEYQKWFSGKAECWGDFSATAALTASIGSEYMSPILSLDLPAGLFMEAPLVDLSSLGNNGVEVWHLYKTTVESFTYRLSYPVSHNENAWEFHVHARGNWCEIDNTTGLIPKKEVMAILGVADWVIENGTTDIWKWQKWASGRFTVQGRKEYANYTDIKCSIAYGSIYHEMITIDLPFEIVDWATTAIVHVDACAAGTDFAARPRFYSSTQLIFAWINPVSYSGSGGVYGPPIANITIDGRWTDEVPELMTASITDEEYAELTAMLNS